MEKITGSTDLYAELLRDIYNAEVLEVGELLTFKNQAESNDLKEVISDQITYSRAHILRLEDFMDEIQQSLLEDHCRTMRSIITEATVLVLRCTGSYIRDVVINHSLQKITQCKIMIYKTLLTLASNLALPKEVEQLGKCINEEEDTLESLNQIMISTLNLTQATS